MNKIICLWSCPRNVSTALMYSFGNRSDTEITDEVLYGYYLSKSNLNHPGKNEIIENLECNSQKVINEIILKQGAEYTTMGDFVSKKYENSLIIGADHFRMSDFYKINSPSLPVLYLKNNYK